MTQPSCNDSEAVDQLVRDHLDRLADRLDPQSLIDRVVSTRPPASADIRDEQDRDDRRQLGRRIGRRLAWTITAAAALTIAFLSGRSMTPTTASAATVLRDVQQAFSQSVDRCYQVHFSPNPEYWDGESVLQGPSDTVLWTRGDRFWADVTLGNIRVVFGRDEQGELWVSPKPSRGIRLMGEDGTGELPPEIAAYCALNTMSVPALVEQVLTDFDLRADAPLEHHLGDSSVGNVEARGHSVVWATLKPGRTHPWISSALWEADAQGTLVRLVLWAVDGDRLRGTSTFTLIETGRIDNEQYQLSAHLDADAEVRNHRFEMEDDVNGSTEDDPVIDSGSNKEDAETE